MSSHRIPAYSHRRPDSQFVSFRRPVPADVLPYWTGPKEINFSLRTNDPTRSRQLIAHYSSAYDDYFDQLRAVHSRPWRRLHAANLQALSAEVSAALEQALIDADAEAQEQGLAQIRMRLSTDRLRSPRSMRPIWLRSMPVARASAS